MSSWKYRFHIQITICALGFLWFNSFLSYLSCHSYTAHAPQESIYNTGTGRPVAYLAAQQDYSQTSLHAHFEVSQRTLAPSPIALGDCLSGPQIIHWLITDLLPPATEFSVFHGTQGVCYSSSTLKFPDLVFIDLSPDWYPRHVAAKSDAFSSHIVTFKPSFMPS